MITCGRSLAFVLVTTCLSLPLALSQSISINSSDLGWWQEDGHHDANNKNYAVGNGYSTTTGPSEDRDVSTPLSSLRATGTNQFAIFNVLGTGTSYGAVTVSAADNGTFVVVNLNAAGIAYLNNNLGSDVAIAGAITTLDRSEPNEQGLFRFTPGMPIPGNTKLEVVIPEPASGSILLVAILIMQGWRRHRRSRINSPGRAMTSN
jgi:hypothetical protein